MYIMIKTKPNTNSNIYGVMIDKENKRYEVGYGMGEFADFHATRKEIDNFIKYSLNHAGFTRVDRI